MRNSHIYNQSILNHNEIENPRPIVTKEIVSDRTDKDKTLPFKNIHTECSGEFPKHFKR
jgi:hypothetical protein